MEVSNNELCINVAVTDDYKVDVEVPELHLQADEDFRVFYYNNKDFYSFRALDYFNKPYSFEEKYKLMVRKNPNLDTWIKEFGLIPNE